jgi:hypothetical protein
VRWAWGVAPEAVATLLDVQVGLDRTVGDEPVAEDAVQVGLIEDRLAILVEQNVIEKDRDIAFTARQTQTGGIAAGVLIVEQRIVPEHGFVDVLSGEIELVIMEPQLAQSLTRVTIQIALGGVAGIDIRIMLVLEAQGIDRVAVAFRRVWALCR